MNKQMRKLSKSHNPNPTINILRAAIKQAERSLNATGPGGGGPSPKADGSGDSGSFHYM